jgi:hypothetical protein
MRTALWPALHACLESAENTAWVCQLLNIYSDSSLGRQHNLWRVVPRATVALSCCQLVLVINETPSRAWLSWQRSASLRPTFQLLTWAIYLAITRLRFECKLVWQKVWSVKKHDEQNLERRETQRIFPSAGRVIVLRHGKSTWHPLAYFVY